MTKKKALLAFGIILTTAATLPLTAKEPNKTPQIEEQPRDLPKGAEIDGLVISASQYAQPASMRNALNSLAVKSLDIIIEDNEKEEEQERALPQSDLEKRINVSFLNSLPETTENSEEESVETKQLDVV